jgi:hypothetical protein
VAEPLAPEARDAPEPVAPDEPDAEAAALVWTWTVVELFALTTTVRVWLKAEPVPGRTRVWRPGPTAGMSAGRG